MTVYKIIGVGMRVDSITNTSEMLSSRNKKPYLDCIVNNLAKILHGLWKYENAAL